MTRRITVGVLVFGLSALAVTTQQPTPAAAQKVNPQASTRTESAGPSYSEIGRSSNYIASCRSR